MIDLNDPDAREDLEKLIKADIDAYCVNQYHSDHREHLGASIMGDPCSRRLWYTFRWAKQETFSGRMLRLFEVGNQFEPRMIEMLRGIGFEVWEKDPETNKQFKITGCDGHYGGGLDGKCKAPARYNIDSELVFLNEFKTNGTGSGFAKVETDGVEKSKPKHYAQMCQYGWHYKLKYGLYIIENKNDSDLIIKIVPLDWRIGQELQNKANDIITSKFPPSRVAENPAYFECKFCTFHAICWHNQPVEINCRSCKLSDPVSEAQWYCNRYQQIIPTDYVKTGCEGHVSVNS